MSQHFNITEHNPNDDVGGGGCLCSDTKVADCQPPYAVFYATETDSGLSPHVVACYTCLAAATDACEFPLPDAEVVVEASDGELVVADESGSHEWVDVDGDEELPRI